MIMPSWMLFWIFVLTGISAFNLSALFVLTYRVIAGSWPRWMKASLVKNNGELAETYDFTKVFYGADIGQIISRALEEGADIFGEGYTWAIKQISEMQALTPTKDFQNRGPYSARVCVVAKRTPRRK